MYFDLEIHQVSTEYRSKYDIPPVLFLLYTAQP